ncbi:polysaccharide deacetylase family protein [Nocardioides mangrovicus]|uniref:Polysaccharide deacetylase family protein n=1 Tax=Nocardioides mangrovicus TaxID=2478913 RepID=A0A3L8P0B0_9ACTN|nr:polysaccharide deacetylase family protein [Nocardioides mangrovicus]RLV48441.1 polysaccharide deacetylase family protein [Nocardioides mangrovicus]
MAATFVLQQGTAPAAVPAPAAPVTQEHGHSRGACSKGLVALTFDDGPRPGTTKPLVRSLRRLGVPATFFEIGEHVAAHPALSRFVAAHGFAVENHSWSHPDLARLRKPGIRRQVVLTQRAFRRAHVRPGNLLRPPYGAVSARVDQVVAAHGLVPVLWNVDSGDWRGGGSARITASVLAQLVPGRSNVVLQHDGVDNSPASVRAVPRIVRAARHRGYCFAALGTDGTPQPPQPLLRATVLDGREGARPVAVVLRLDKPTTVPTSVRLVSVDGTARAGAAYTRLDTVVRFARGVSYAIVRVPVAATGPGGAFTVRVEHPTGLQPTATTLTATITG